MRLVKSPLPQKKWRAIFQDGTHTDFGDSTMQDYTQHHDTQRRANYKSRHSKDLETGDPRRAGFLSYYLLWGQSTSLQENLRHYKQRFGNL
jgi:Family of unknown function (DUF5754)